MEKLTKVEVDNLKPSDKDAFVWADDPKGFGVKVFTSDVKWFVFQYRTKEGRTRRAAQGGSLRPTQTGHEDCRRLRRIVRHLGQDTDRAPNLPSKRGQ